MEKTRQFLILFLLLLITGVSAYPVLNSGESGYVSDFANVLSESEKARLNEIIISIEKNTSVEIAVVTVKDTGGEDRIMYASKLGGQNGVGKKASDNGVVVLWSLDNERGGAIATGRGIESVLNDAKVGRIGRDSRIYFDRGEYYPGFEHVLNSIRNELIQQGGVGIVESSSEYPAAFWVIIFMALITLMIILLVALSSSKQSRYPHRASSYVGRSYGSWSSHSSGGFGGFGGGSFGGGGARF